MKLDYHSLINLLSSIWKKDHTKPDIHKDKRRKIVLFLERFNDAIKNPVFDVIVKVFPGHGDDAILRGIRQWLPSILNGLYLAEMSNFGAAVMYASHELNKLSKEERAGYIKMIGGDLYERFTGIELGQAIEDIQKEYDEMKQGGELG